MVSIEQMFDKTYTRLRTVFGESVKIYGATPQSLAIEYPCVIIRPGEPTTAFYDNIATIIRMTYSCLYITKSGLDEQVANLAQKVDIQYDRSYVVDNLYHHAFQIFVNV